MSGGYLKCSVYYHDGQRDKLQLPSPDSPSIADSDASSNIPPAESSEKVMVGRQECRSAAVYSTWIVRDSNLHLTWRK